MDDSFVVGRNQPLVSARDNVAYQAQRNETFEAEIELAPIEQQEEQLQMQGEGGQTQDRESGGLTHNTNQREQDLLTKTTKYDNETESNYDLDEPWVKGHFYISLLLATVPLSFAINGLFQPQTILIGTLPSTVSTLFVILIVISGVKILYTIAAIGFVHMNYDREIPKNPKIVFTGIAILFILAFSICCGLAWRSPTELLDSCTENFEEVWDKQLAAAYETAYQNFCTAACPCDLKFRSIITEKEYTRIQPYISDVDSHINYSKCPNYKETTDTFIKLKQMENNWNCSGICKAMPLFFFSDINKGTPSDRRNCFEVAIQDKLPILLSLIIKSCFFSILGFIFIWTHFFFFNERAVDPNSRQNEYDRNSSGSGEDLLKDESFLSWEKDINNEAKPKGMLQNQLYESAFKRSPPPTNQPEKMQTGTQRTKMEGIEMQTVNQRQTTLPQIQTQQNFPQAVDSNTFMEMLKQHRYQTPPTNN